ncbi:MAG: MBL fold metallo-hydrolase [Paludibacteraceae bacterium]|nr:MBL fold metallo-hydrolase [Prevotellaceae bacterium]
MRKYICYLLLTVAVCSACASRKNEVDVIRLSDGSDLQIEFIKHGSLLLTYEGRHIYVDPTSLFADYSEYPTADVLLFTHDHEDHFDTLSVVRLRKNDTEVVGNESVIQTLGLGKSMKNGDCLSAMDGKIRIEAVPAYNTTPAHAGFHTKGRDNGYVLTIGGTSIYIAADTEAIPEMADLKSIDIAFIPANQPYTMTVDQVVAAARMIKPKVLYPYHYGETDVQQLVGRLPEMEVRIRQMQ